MRSISIGGFLILIFSSIAYSDVMQCADSSLSSDSWVQKYLETSETVFLGVVISVDTPRFDTPPSDETVDASSEITDPPNASSMAELLNSIQKAQATDSERNTQVASFNILRSWKEARFPVVRTKSQYAPGQYGFPFEVGEVYLGNL